LILAVIRQLISVDSEINRYIYQSILSPSSALSADLVSKLISATFWLQHVTWLNGQC